MGINKRYPRTAGVGIVLAAIVGCAQEDDVRQGEASLAFPSVIFPVADVAGTTWYHAGGSPFHRPHGGYSYANDQYALDLNLASDGDAGLTVRAIQGGTVVQKDTSLGWVLVRSPCTVTWGGVAYSNCYAGYMHMRSIPAGVTVGSTVTQGATLGVVGNVASFTVPNHLHFAFYVASSNRVADIAAGRNGFLESVDPASVLGGPFANLNLTSKVTVSTADDQVSTLRSTTSGDFGTGLVRTGGGYLTDNLYGYLDGLTYRTSAVSSSDGVTWRFDDPVPATGSYGIWVFVPRNHGTATVRYNVLVNGATRGSWTIPQASYSDRYVSLLGYGTTLCGVSGATGNTIALNAGDRVRVTASMGTGSATTQIAIDAVQVVRRYADCNNVYK